jgi:ubiquinone/menaquinone biosynthesis C-methylase UbiE
MAESKISSYGKLSYKFKQCFETKDSTDRLRGVLGDNTFQMVKQYIKSNDNNKANGNIDGIDDDSIFKYLASRLPKMADDSFNTNKVKYLDNVDVNADSKVLDFGGANGMIAAEIARRYKLKEVCVADVHEDAYAVKDPAVKYSTAVDGKLPYPDNTFDVICSFMVLHHIPPEQIKKSIEELHRCSKRYLIIQEHDSSPQLEKILDILHGMYLFVHKEKDYQSLANFQEYVAWYRSANEWNEMLSGKFKLIKFFRTNRFTNNYVAYYEKVDGTDNVGSTDNANGTDKKLTSNFIPVSKFDVVYRRNNSRGNTGYQRGGRGGYRGRGRGRGQSKK